MRSILVSVMLLLHTAKNPSQTFLHFASTFSFRETGLAFTLFGRASCHLCQHLGHTLELKLKDTLCDFFAHTFY